MANLKKSFNFRHGVQVDDDNFIVDSLGKVGIGSTIPTQVLDVSGNINVRGTLFAEVVNTGSLVNTGEDGTASFSLINVGVTSLTAGIITSSDPNGIVTYYGDARYLQGMPTSQWKDMDVGLGFTSIYNEGNVGVGTTDPRYTFQVGDTDSDENLISGVGINSVGNIDLTGTLKVGTAITASSGVITATKFVGSGAGLTSLNASNITTGTIDTARFGNINNSSGIVTVSKVEASTFTGTLVGIATTASDLTSDAEISITSVKSSSSDLGVTTTTKLEANTLYAITSVGIGTSTVSADLHLRKDGVAEMQITSNDDRARLVIGRDTTAFGNNFIIDTDNDDPNAYPVESGLNSVDIYNYAPGNLNFFIRPDSAINKKFNWINHSTNKTMMSLTQDGNLGIGTTDPNNDLHIVGTSTVTSSAHIGGNLEVAGLTTFHSSLTSSGLFRTSNKIGIGLTAGDVDPTYDFQVGYSVERVGIQTGAYITEKGEAGFTGIVTAKKFSGIGSDLTNIDPANISDGAITATNLNINSTSGIVTAKKFIGIGSDLTNINPKNISDGAITATNLNINSTSGIVTVSKVDATTFDGNFIGSGTSITSLKPENISDGAITATNLNINSTSGIITAGIVTATNLYGNGSNITSIDPGNISAGTFGGSSYSFNPQISVGSFNIYYSTGSFDSQVGIASEVDRISINDERFYSIEYLLSVYKTGKIQTSKVLVSLVGYGATFSHSISTTVSHPSSIFTVGVTTINDGGGSNTNLIVSVTPTETGIMTYKSARYLL